MAVSGASVEALIQVVGEDKISAILTNVESSFKDIAKEAKHNEELSDKYGKTLGKVAGKVEKVKAKWDEVSDKFSKVVSVLQTIGSGVAFIHEQMTEAAREKGIEDRFNHLTKAVGGAGFAMMELRAASAGAVDDTSLQKAGATALQAGISFKDTAELMTLAARAASAGMGDQTELTQQFIASIADRSDGLMRQMGLELDFGQILGKTATRLGVSADALSENTKRAIILREVMPKLQDAFGSFSADGPVQQLGRMKAEMDNLESAARAYAQAKILGENNPVIKSAVRSMEIVTDAIDRTGDTLLDFQGFYFSAVPEMAEGGKIQFHTLSEQFQYDKAREDLQRFAATDAGVRQRLMIEIGKVAAERVRDNDTLTDATERATVYTKEVAALAEKLGVYAELEHLIADQHDKTAKAIEETTAAQTKRKQGLDSSASPAEIEKQALEDQARANKQAAIEIEGSTKALAKNQVAQAGLLLTQGDGISAIQLLNTAISSGKLPVELLGHAYIELNEAEAKVNAELIKQAPLMASANSLSGDHATAVALLRTALDKAGGSARNLSEIIKDLVGAEAEDSAATASNAMAKAELFEMHGDLQGAAQQYKAALDTGTLSLSEQEQAIRAIEIAHNDKAKTDFQQILLNADIADSLGFSKRAADLYKRAMSAIPAKVDLANASMAQLVGMADATTNAMIKTVAVTMELDAAQLSMMEKGADGYAELESRVNVAMSRLKGMLEGQARVQTKIDKRAAPRRTGGGAGDSDAKAMAKQLALFEKYALESSDVVELIKARAKEISGTIGGLAAQYDQGIMADAWDPDKAEQNVQRFADRAAAAQKKYNKQVSKLNDEFNALTKSSGVEKSKMLMDYLKDEKKQRLEILKTQLEQEKEMHAQSLEQYKEVIKAREEITAAMVARQEQAFSDAIAMGGQQGAEWVGRFATATEGIKVEVDRLSGIFGNLEKGLITQEEAMQKAVPGMASAMGQVTSQVTDDVKKQAYIKMLFEIAASAAAYAWGDVRGGTMHALAAVLYAAVGSTHKGATGGGGKGSAPRTPTINQPPQDKDRERGPKSITINFTGTVVGTDERAARELATLIRKDMKWGTAGEAQV